MRSVASDSTSRRDIFDTSTRAREDVAMLFRLQAALARSRVVAMMILLAGCGGDSITDPIPPVTPVASVVEHDLAILAFAIATGRQGASFFDNFLPCVNRGLADYSNTPTGRRASIHGCDIGGGVTFDGSGNLDWTTSNATEVERQRVNRVEWTGALTAVNGASTRSVPSFVVEAFYSTAADNTPVGFHNLDSLWVTVDGTTTKVADAAAFEDFWNVQTRSIGSIPNPSGSVLSLSEVDIRRLVFDAGIEWFVLLVGEFEPRGPHTHEEACGVISVTYDGLGGLPRLASSFDACPMSGGLFMSGQFDAEFTTPLSAGSPFPSPIGWSLAGSFEVGGGVPRVSLSSIQMLATIPPNVTGILQVTGTLRGADGTEIPFDFSVLVDD